MKLRRQISLFLLLLGLAPLLVAVAINIPLVLDRLELFYHKAYLQKLRADFRDLDQHITRRQETVRLFAKMPEPGMVTTRGGKASQDILAQQRTGYTDWANRVLFDQPDIIQVAFVRKDGDAAFALQRDKETGVLTPAHGAVDLPRDELIAAGMKVAPGAVLTSPISVDRDRLDTDPQRFMTLSFVSPLYLSAPKGGAPQVQGAVIVNLDVGGLAHAYSGLYWALSNGEYLSPGPKGAQARSDAFGDFPGLEEIFANNELALWENGSQQIFWLPLFMTEHSGPLWVGRSVDPSPIAEFRDALELRVVLIVSGMLLVVFVVARVIALRIERISRELTDGIARMLEQNQAVTFSWKRPEELRTLGEKLSRLAEKHAEDATALRLHAQELEESNRYKSEFLANVSHELRTPLNSILLLSKMLAGNGELPEPHVRQAQVIHAAGNDLRTLIDTILDLSRIEAGKVSIKTAPVKLRGLLDGLLELMRPQFVEKGLALELRVAPDAPATLVTDHDKLRQILVNFLSNALKFTERGRVTLALERNIGAQSGAYPVRIRVSDTGIGIPADKQALVFEAFKQVDGSTSRRYGGTGLGLTISRELAGLIGGRIELDSRLGEGSTFTLLLPLSVDAGSAGDAPAQAAARTPPAAGGDAPIPSADYTGSRVLVVDDDLRNLLALTPLLEKWGIAIAAAGDGEEALETLRDDGPFDLVLMDLMMPGMDGFTAIRAIRSQSRQPVVALTARAADDDRQRALACGADDLVAKPVDPAELKAVLDRYLARPSGHETPAATTAQPT